MFLSFQMFSSFQPHLRLQMVTLLQFAVQQQGGHHLVLGLLLNADHFLRLLLHLQIGFNELTELFDASLFYIKIH